MAICRSLLLSRRLSTPPHLRPSSLFRRFHSLSPTPHSNPTISPHPNLTPSTYTFPLISRPAISIPFHPFTSAPDPPEPGNRNPKLVNFSLSDSESQSDSEQDTQKNVASNSTLPPPYDPFNKKPATDKPQDPKNLQQVFHKMRTEGLIQNAVKMFDVLSKEGLTHEALELFRIIKDKGTMPDVVAHTAVLEAYADAGQLKEALKVFLRMLASGVAPNAYTYAVLIKALAGGDEKMVEEAKKYLMEMVGKGMKPNAETYTRVFEALVKEGKEEESREMVKAMQAKGFQFDQKTVTEVVKGKRGAARHVFNIIFGK